MGASSLDTFKTALDIVCQEMKYLPFSGIIVMCTYLF